MSKRSSLTTRSISLSLLLFLLCLTVTPVLGQQEGEKKKQRRKIEVEKVYQKWLDEDVRYIITNEERAAFKKLQTDEEREEFIEQFWLRRDPDPDTNENEYREEYYRRIAYSNEKFASGIPGWRTDRGRIYITFGPPDSIEAHPAGGPYERPYYEGGGNTSTFPFEIWFYRYLEGVGSGIEIEFVDPTGSGEYRIAQSPDEKDALLYTPNGGLTLYEQLGITSKKDRPFFNPGNRNNQNYFQRAQDQPFERLALYANLQKAPAVKYRALAEKVDQVTEFDVLPFSLRTDYVRAGDNSGVMIFTAHMQNADLSFKNIGGIQQATVNIFARVTALSGKRAGIFEDPATITYPEQELQLGLKQSSVYQKSVVLPPGRYKIDMVVRDITSGHTGVVHHGFEVPVYNQDRMMTSSLIIADTIEPLKNRVAAGQFIIGSNKVRPNVSQVFKPYQNLGVYMQVYNVQIDQTTLQPAVDVEYVLTRKGKEVLRVKEDGKNGISDLTGYAQQVTLGRAFPLKDLEPGDYEITVVVTDRVARQTISPKTYFTLLDPEKLGER
ncbi:MAG: GWxTD domain-containing protein [Blastocatellia bacterium]|nr:GWxTD domain-containing protein [Blastocatellia bacterium]